MQFPSITVIYRTIYSPFVSITPRLIAARVPLPVSLVGYGIDSLPLRRVPNLLCSAMQHQP